MVVQGSINPYQGSCDIVTVGSTKVGLSKGTIAAIAIASIVGILLIIGVTGAIVWCCCCQIRR